MLSFVKELHALAGRKVKILWDVENCRLPVNRETGKVVTFTRVVSEIDVAMRSAGAMLLGLCFVAIRHQNVKRLLAQQREDLQRSTARVTPLYSDLDAEIGDKYGVADNRLKPLMRDIFDDWDASNSVKNLCVLLLSGDGDYRDEAEKFLSKGALVVVLYPTGGLGAHMKSLETKLLQRSDLKFNYHGPEAILPVPSTKSSPGTSPAVSPRPSPPPKSTSPKHYNPFMALLK